MGKLAIVATIKTVAGKRDEYLKRLKAHAQRYLATEPGTLKFEIILPHDQADTVMLYELHASPEAFETHWHGPAKQEATEAYQRFLASIMRTSSMKEPSSSIAKCASTSAEAAACKVRIARAFCSDVPMRAVHVGKSIRSFHV